MIIGSSSHITYFATTTNDSHTTDLGGVLWPIGYAAGELLRSKELRLVKHCPSCGWLFLDRSKNGQRRWYSMNNCGVDKKIEQYRADGLQLIVG